MPDADLGPKPDPEIEPGEPNPGGVDAVSEAPGDADPVPADMSPEDNPAVEDALPDEVKEGEDTSTEATETATDDDNTGAADEADRESPA